MKKKHRFTAALLCCTAFLSGQIIDPTLLQQRWPAYWIAAPNTQPTSYAVLHFRKSIVLDRLPAQFVVHVSADTRYRLYVNGQYVAAGPARSDLMHWNFESLDLAPYLKTGQNTFAAVVWNFGEHAPWAQMSNKTGFILQGNSPESAVLNTNRSWKVCQNSAYQALPVDAAKMATFIVTGAGEIVDAALYPHGWESNAFDDTQWTNAITLEHGYPSGVGSGAGWYLVPRSIPPLEETPLPAPAIREITGLNANKVSDGFLKGGSPQLIPPHSTVRMLLDQGYETVAYPILKVSGGKAALVQLTYAEALMGRSAKKATETKSRAKPSSAIATNSNPTGRWSAPTSRSRSEPFDTSNFW